MYSVEMNLENNAQQPLTPRQEFTRGIGVAIIMMLDCLGMTLFLALFTWLERSTKNSIELAHALDEAGGESPAALELNDAQKTLDTIDIM